MEARVQHSAQQTTKNGQAAMTTFNGQKKKMKNLTESPKYKTVLAPNAPWPKQEPKKEQKPKVQKIREQVNKSKIAIQFRVRDVSTGRLKGSNRLAG
jgi:hypothetical protein